ncbi:MAG: nicotinate (nicotinamide) nucleotide adenylyltransferase [Oscillospiraceae bacterium]|nr:nicotinate (nicotinamide) nucleotide adenylyltransferase [Oscillospiraceae bacterium]
MGVLGGTFNPPHVGHLRLAKAAADEIGMDKVLIVPSCIPPHKLPGKLADGKARLEMCRIAFSCDSRFEISSIELDRGSRSYTVETLRELKKQYPDDELYFIIGSDMLETFTGWYLWEEILSLARICAASRENGYNPDLSGFTEEQKKRIILLKLPPLEISSTELRGAIARGDNSELLDPAVAEYIRRNGLYDDGLSSFRKIITEKLDSHRLYHSECVSECAALLAEKYGADAEKARLAGLMHDVMKNASAEEQLDYMSRAGETLSEVETVNRKVWHQISGAAFLKIGGLIADEEILGAVRWHTTGKSGMTLLEKIVYVADFISADRDYGDIDVVRRLADLSLEHAILYTSRYTVRKMISGDLPLHPATVDCYNDMLLHFGVQKG